MATLWQRGALLFLYLVGMAGAVHFPQASEYAGQAVLSEGVYELFWKLEPNSDSPKTISLAIHVQTAGCMHTHITKTVNVHNETHTHTHTHTKQQTDRQTGR